MLIDLTKFKIRAGAVADTEVFDGPAVLGWYEGDNWTKSQGSLGLGLMAFVGQVSDQVGDVPMTVGQVFVDRMNAIGLDIPNFDPSTAANTRIADRMISDEDDAADDDAEPLEAGAFPDE